MRKQEEKELEDKVIQVLNISHWLVKKVHGSGQSKHWPDLYCLHRWYGSRWIELKLPGAPLSKGQIIEFGKWKQHGARIWIVTCLSDLKLIHQPTDNLGQYLRNF